MKDKMAKPLGLTKRGGSYQLRVVIPKDLRQSYGRSDFRVSLGPLDRREAQARAHSWRADKEAEFAAKRLQLAGQRVETVGPELAKAIARGVFVRQLQRDDYLRENSRGSSALAALASKVAPGKALALAAEPEPTARPAEGLSEEAARVLSDLNSHAEADAAINLARRNLSAVLPLAEEVARDMGLVINWNNEAGRAALRDALLQYRLGAGARARRDVGEAIETPIAPAVVAPLSKSESRTLKDVLPIWEAVNQPGESARRKVAYAARLFDERYPDVLLSQITKAQGSEFISHLLATCTAQKTAQDHFNSIKSLLNFACDKQDWIPSNPWRAHAVTVKKSRPRKPWPADALARLFDSDIFSSYSLPITTNAGADAAYWVPLLGLYTGARQSELCQLRVEDVSEGADGLTLTIIRDAGDEEEAVPETAVKSASTQRRVPVHSELIRLGFGDYVSAMRQAEQARLFPSIRIAPGRPAGEYFSDWFSRYRKQQGITQRYQDFHAFRHTSRTRLTDAGVEDVISAALMGHAVSGNTGRNIYDHSIATLRPSLERLCYPELALPRVYRKP